MTDTRPATGESSPLRSAEPFTIVTLDAFLRMSIPPRRKLLDPWLPEQGLAMIHAPRGIGKTYLALSVAIAVASAGRLLGWHAPRAASVCYVDGEMPAADLQDRLSALLMADLSESTLADLSIGNPYFNNKAGMPDLGTLEGRRRLDAAIPDGTELIVLDNLSSLVSGDENDGTVWAPVQKWALQHRSRGRSMLLIHHSGKKGIQRGTSRREDVLDTVISLQRPKGYRAGDGARFEVHFEKGRSLTGQGAIPFEAKLTADERSALCWTRKALTNRKELAVAMVDDGTTQAEVAKIFKVDKSTVSRWCAEAQQQMT